MLDRVGPALPIASAVVLIVIAIVTIQLCNNPVPALFGHTTTNQQSGAPPIDNGRTPAPSNVVITNPKVTVPGTLVYAKAGNLWVQNGTTAKQITNSVKGSVASSPAWSPDGQWIYYIDTRQVLGSWPPGNPSLYTLTYPVFCRVHPDGTGNEDLLSGLFSRGSSLRYFYWIRQPSIAPNGALAAVVSDGPQPDGQDTVLQFIDLASNKLQSIPRIQENPPLGHSDPAYRPDGKVVAFVMEGRNGVHAAPSIWLYDVAKRTAKQLSGTGFRSPSWSPDGRYIAATRATATNTDIVILDTTTGKQVAEVTTDGFSWAPVWSPAGDEIVYSHLSGQIVDLYMVHVTQTDGVFTFKVEPDLTQYSGLDGSSRAAWYIPPDQLPPPTPEPTPTIPPAPASGASAAPPS